jgi:hypothetical protein
LVGGATKTDLFDEVFGITCSGVSKNSNLVKVRERCIPQGLQFALLLLGSWHGAFNPDRKDGIKLISLGSSCDHVDIIGINFPVRDRDQNDNQSPGSRSSCSCRLMQNATKLIFGTRRF